MPSESQSQWPQREEKKHPDRAGLGLAMLMNIARTKWTNRLIDDYWCWLNTGMGRTHGDNAVGPSLALKMRRCVACSLPHLVFSSWGCHGLGGVYSASCIERKQNNWDILPKQNHRSIIIALAEFWLLYGISRSSWFNHALPDIVDISWYHIVIICHNTVWCLYMGPTSLASHQFSCKDWWGLAAGGIGAASLRVQAYGTERCMKQAQRKMKASEPTRHNYIIPDSGLWEAALSRGLLMSEGESIGWISNVHLRQLCASGKLQKNTWSIWHMGITMMIWWMM